jgi:hypothetical protein
MIQIEFCSRIYTLNSDKNFKLTQLKLCSAYSNSPMKNLNIFGAGKNFILNLQIQTELENRRDISIWAGPTS